MGIADDILLRVLEDDHRQIDGVGDGFVEGDRELRRVDGSPGGDRRRADEQRIGALGHRIACVGDSVGGAGGADAGDDGLARRTLPGERQAAAALLAIEGLDLGGVGVADDARHARDGGHARDMLSQVRLVEGQVVREGSNRGDEYAAQFGVGHRDLLNSGVLAHYETPRGVREALLMSLP